MVRRSLSPPSHKHDKNTGQIFNEWLVRPNTADKMDWYRVIKGLPLPSQVPQKKSPAKGARSLVEITISIVANQFHLLEVDDVKHVPCTMIYRVWEFMKNNHPYVPLQSLKIFAKHLDPHQMPLGLCKRDYKIPRTTGPLSVYTNPAISSSFDFIVHLTLVGHHSAIDTPQLLSLTQLKNLGVLEIIQPCPSSSGTYDFPRMSDAIIRQWSEEPEPFPVLRVMRIWGDHFTTPHSLRYLSKFPALTVYDVAGLERDWGFIPQIPEWSAQGQIWGANKHIFKTLHKYLAFLGADVVYHPDWQRDIGVLERWSDIAWALTSPREEGEIQIADRDEVWFACPDNDHSDQEDFKERASIFSVHKDRIACLETNVTLQTWGYFLYCHIGHLSSDKDLVAQAVPHASKAFSTHTGFIIPPRPYVTLQLGTCCPIAPSKAVARRVCCRNGTERKFEVYQTFSRAERDPEADATSSVAVAQEASSTNKRPSDSTASPPRMRKKPKTFPIDEFMGQCSPFLKSTDPNQMDLDQ
ncbi:hypothetical protein GGR53DRAFT_496606 [Hypoxylon sp. FL1150]|nr:hypothetical protein GGR53DRAFT_496606 [Hypoxylon sp. FL1150]